MISPNKLTNRGFSHLLVPVLAFLLVAALGGAYFLAKSHAATPSSTSSTTTSTTETGTTEPASNITESPPNNAASMAANLKNMQAAASNPLASHVCLAYDSNLCWDAHGTNQVTITNGNNAKTNWTQKYPSSAGRPYAIVEFQDGSNNCLRANSSHTVTTSNGSCSEEAGEEWYIVAATADGHFRVISAKFYPNYWYLGTVNNTNGYKVWADSKSTLGWLTWALE